MDRKTLRWMPGLVLMLGLGVVSPVHAAEPSESNGAIAITMPSEYRRLSFQIPGVLSEVPVKEGDIIKAGDPLMKQDDRLEKAVLDAINLEANSTLPVEFAQADLDNKRVELKRIEELFKLGGIASQTELDRARLDVLQAEIRLKLAHQETAQKKLEAKAQEIKIVQKHLDSPIDGVVHSLDLGVGEVVDPQKPAMVLVKNDPLHVEIHLATWQAARLKVGETMRVKYVDDQEWQSAAIIFMAPVADAASDTRLVRMELPNASHKPSGLQVMVQLPEKLLSPRPIESAQAGE